MTVTVRQLWWKRPFDLAVAVVLLVPALLVGMVVALLVRFRLGSPVLFRQERPGRGGRPFRMVKFRTMTDDVGPDGAPLADAERLTPFGRRLRSTSLDELPELWNVLTGDMSIVGPRPLLTAYLALYSPEQARRMAVRPGITGWAQVRGRNALSWPERFALDVWYVEHASLGLDLRILGATLGQVIARRHVNQPGHATMERFTGNG